MSQEVVAALFDNSQNSEVLKFTQHLLEQLGADTDPAALALNQLLLLGFVHDITTADFFFAAQQLEDIDDLTEELSGE